MSEKKYEYVRKTTRYNGKKYEATGKTEAEAIMKLAEKLAAAKRGEEVVSGSMTVDAWFEQWIEMYKIPKGLTENTIYNYRVEYENHLRPYIGKMKLAKVKNHHLQSAINLLQGKSASLVKKVYGMTRSMFHRARQSRLIPYDPAEMLECPKFVSGHRRALTRTEREAFIEVAKKHTHGTLMLTLLYTGMRPGEAAALKWENVDFKSRVIFVKEARASGGNGTKAPKTESGIRKIPISNELYPLLLRMQQPPEKLVFPNKVGKIMTNQSMCRKWNSIKCRMETHIQQLEEEKKPVSDYDLESLTMYCLRHTFCTDLEAAGVPINVAKSLMGHSDITMTANIYTHTDDDVAKRAIQMLDEANAKHGANQSTQHKWS